MPAGFFSMTERWDERERCEVQVDVKVTGFRMVYWRHS